MLPSSPPSQDPPERRVYPCATVEFTQSLTSLVLTVSPSPVLPAGCGMTPAELALSNPSSLCWSEFGVVLLDAKDFALPTERADAEATPPRDCFDGVTDGTGTSRLARSSSSKKSRNSK